MDKSLSHTQLQHVCKCYQLTHESQLMDALMKSYQPLIRQVAFSLRAYCPYSMEQEDLLGYAQIGFLEAVDHFKPQEHTNFEGYAVQWIRGAVLKGTIEFSGLRRIQSVKDENLCIFPVELGEGSVLNDIPDPVPEIELAEDRIIEGIRGRELEKEMGRLTPLQRKILHLHYFEDIPLRTIGKMLGFSHSWIGHQHQCALVSLREDIMQNQELMKDPFFTEKNGKSGIDFLDKDWYTEERYA